jgi:hypothetical protein
MGNHLGASEDGIALGQPDVNLVGLVALRRPAPRAAAQRLYRRLAPPRKGSGPARAGGRRSAPTLPRPLDYSLLHRVLFRLRAHVSVRTLTLRARAI